MKSLLLVLLFLFASGSSAPVWALDDDTLKKFDESIEQLKISKQKAKDAARNLYRQLENSDPSEKNIEELDGIKKRIEGFNALIFENESKKRDLLESIAKRGKDCTSGNCINGFGTRNYSSGNYSGKFSNGKFQGRGAYVFLNGISYTGDWESGRIQGNCIKSDASNISEKGECSEINNVIHFKKLADPQSVLSSNVEEPGFFAKAWEFLKKVFVFLLFPFLMGILAVLAKTAYSKNPMYWTGKFAQLLRIFRQYAVLVGEKIRQGWIFSLRQMGVLFEKGCERIAEAQRREVEAQARRERERLAALQRQEEAREREAEAQRQREIERQRAEAESHRQREIERQRRESKAQARRERERLAALQRQEEARQREAEVQRQREVERRRLAEISMSANHSYRHNGEIPPELI